MVTAKYKNILITGAAGFIGSHFTKLILKKGTFDNVFVVDKFSIGSNPKNLDLYYSLPNFKFFKIDISDQHRMNEFFRNNKVDCIVNFAAESHVDRSLVSSIDFISSNYTGVATLLELSRAHNVKKFVQVSTDEVCFSDDIVYPASEESPYNPQNPYSISKCAADMLCKVYPKTYKDLKVVITRGSNTFGPAQYTEKMIPKLITNALENKPLEIYGDGSAIRDYMFVEDHANGIFKALVKGISGEVYNLCSYNYFSGIGLAHLILELIPESKSEIKFVTDRPNHDMCYAIDCSKAESDIGFKYNKDSFKKNLVKTIDWYRDNYNYWNLLYI